jgi:sugar/nucleoside kinase (ribokinase family)
LKQPDNQRDKGLAAPNGASAFEAIVAGHICLDMIPDMGNAGLAAISIPGALVNVGEAVISTGGTVANSGLALNRLGIRTGLMGKVGDDPFGRLILETLREHGEGITEGMIVSAGEQSSYSVVISPRGSDRIFLHCPGTNDTFTAEDVPPDTLEGARLFHFGYPPLMKRMYEDDGRELEKLLAKVKAKGLTVSLDMSRPDPDSPAGKVEWSSILRRILPHVDLFMPSWEEIVFMVEGADSGGGELEMNAASLSSISERLLGMGAAVVGIKLGDEGLYVRTSGSAERLQQFGACRLSEPGDWAGRELLSPCFQATVVGTTGAGDCTIAGMICGLLNGLPIESAMTAATAVGACSVEALDACGGIVPWPEVKARIDAGWQRRPVELTLDGWAVDHAHGLWTGPHDRRRESSL